MSMSDLVLPLLILAAYPVFVWYVWRERSPTPWPDDGPRKLEDSRERVLFVCTHNSARSQIAEALLRHRAGSRFLVASAGTAPTSVHRLAEQVMAERGLRLVGHYAKAIVEMCARWDYVITVCDSARELPRLPGEDQPPALEHRRPRSSPGDRARTLGGLPSGAG